eukprot:CAMPEP_0194043194 /NCGR_PEP_ID=MMETSP0009_2-20130614/14866_1 /TAXON_ID=210454 /ORGANISM="Grammatophora oceanica, Strain CCMP 410" /LENGTH=249 /DNA_ID=CAMNT_0038687321 /DNA_START=661 /DNA_END=1410 /DNA_ORIENTATION=+
MTAKRPFDSPKVAKETITSPFDERARFIQPLTTNHYFDDESVLPEGFRPGDYSVICARGRLSSSHPGNKYFKQVVQEHLDAYGAARESRLGKGQVVSSIIDTIRTKSPIGSFVKQDPVSGRWFEISNEMAREKVGGCLRDGLKYPSSTTEKKKRRQSGQVKENEDMSRFIKSNAEVSAVLSSVTRRLSESDMISDERVSEIFDEANVAILSELKRSESLQSFFGSSSNKKAKSNDGPALKRARSLSDGT